MIEGINLEMTMTGKNVVFENSAMLVDELVVRDSSIAFELGSTASIERVSIFNSSSIRISDRSVLNFTGTPYSPSSSSAVGIQL